MRRNNAEAVIRSIIFGLGAVLSPMAQAATGYWAPVASLNNAQVDETLTLLSSGKVLAIGGSNAGRFVPIEMYDPFADRWSVMASAPMQSAFASNFLLPNGKVFLTDGYRAMLYDPALDKWSEAGALSVQRGGYAVCRLATDKLLLLGGERSISVDQFEYVSTSELYDPATNSWTSSIAPMKVARVFHAATLLPSGRVLVTGGNASSVLASTEIYDPTSNQWVAGGSLLVPRSGHRAILLPTGKVLIVGNSANQYGSTFYADAELYDPLTNTSASAGALATARADPAVVALPSGKVLVAGGVACAAGACTVPNAELYDPASNSWNDAGAFVSARYRMSLIALPSGKVLAAGGEDLNYNPLASAEIYTPAAAPPPATLNQFGFTGAWYNPLTTGQGFVIDVLPDFAGAGQGLMAGGWFTFDSSGGAGESQQRWYTLQGAVGNATSASLKIYSTQGGNFNAPPVVSAQQVGSASIAFTDCTHGSLAYTFSDGSGRAGNIPLTRLGDNVSCGASDTGAAAGSDALLSGAWYDKTTSGQGLLFDIVPSQQALFAAWYTYAPNGSAIGGAASQRWYTLQAVLPTPIGAGKALSGVPVYSTTGGVFNDPTKTVINQVGTSTLTFADCNTMTLAYTFTGGGNLGLSGTLHLSRIGPPQIACGF